MKGNATDVAAELLALSDLDVADDTVADDAVADRDAVLGDLFDRVGG